MNRFRYFSAVLLTAIVIFFALQNLDAVEVRLLLWRVEASISLIALGPFLVGLLLGGITALYYAARRGRRAADASPLPPLAAPSPDAPLKESREHERSTGR